MDLTETEAATALLDRMIAPVIDVAGSVPPRPSWLQVFPPRVIEWNRLELPLGRLPRGLTGLRILHLSDFHFRRRWPGSMDALLERMRHDPPDLVLLTGDFVDNKYNHRPGMPQVRRFVEGLTARTGCFAIHGNHDSYQVGVELRDTQVMFLDGRRHVVEMPAGQIELIGLPGKHRIELTPEFLRSLPAPEPDVPRIILSHYPDHLRRTADLQPDLFLAGHTHGGQICLPGGKPLIWHDSLPSKLSRGAHRVGDTWLVVSRGLGATTLPIRVFCNPEVVEIRLIRDKQDGASQ